MHLPDSKKPSAYFSMQRCQVESICALISRAVWSPWVVTHMTLAPFRRGSIHKGILRARQRHGTHTTPGLLSFHFDHTAQTWEWVTHHTENHDLCIHTEKGMISLGQRKKTRGKEGKKNPIKHPNPGMSLLFETQSAAVIHMQVKEVVAVVGFV